MKIEWASSFLSDGTRIEPPPSKMHGWIVKMRGTILGDEKVRSEGMREMKRAKSERKKWDEWRERQEKYRGGGQTTKQKGILALFGLGKKNSPPPRRLQSSRQPGSSRPSYHSSNSHGSRAVRPSPKSGGQSYRSTSSRPHSELRRDKGVPKVKIPRTFRSADSDLSMLLAIESSGMPPQASPALHKSIITLHSISLFLSIVILLLSIEDCGTLSLCLNPLFSVCTAGYHILMLGFNYKRTQNAGPWPVGWIIFCYLLSLAWLGAFIAMSIVLANRAKEIPFYDIRIPIPQTSRVSQKMQLMLDAVAFAILGDLAVKLSVESYYLGKVEDEYSDTESLYGRSYTPTLDSFRTIASSRF
ncbi:hypothetical protein CVT24_010643 [Panaeolus cyanescens]|uniref:MARVEL domain-containing protein n=1 Tax=Panaeolus cyanescens TaxID=181874 RepID=A0A409YM05_9AGAR|nr:hypothetical protein CVT24_010643 [Panaeolus cyanescens]